MCPVNVSINRDSSEPEEISSLYALCGSSHRGAQLLTNKGTLRAE